MAKNTACNVSKKTAPAINLRATSRMQPIAAVITQYGEDQYSQEQYGEQELLQRPRPISTYVWACRYFVTSDLKKPEPYPLQ